MEINGNKVTFELSEEDIAALKASAYLLKCNPDEELKIFIRDLAQRGLNKYNFNYYDNKAHVVVRENDPSTNIRRWVKRQDGVYFLIIKAYMLSSINNEFDVAKVEDIEQNYDKFEKTSIMLSTRDDPLRFLRNLRMLCTDSSRAFGKIFDYDRNEKTVRILPSLKEVIIELKDQIIG